MKKMNFLALIPAYEPEPQMIEVMEGLLKCGFSLVVVNDGSGSSCDELFTWAGAFATVLTHPENRGKGEALKTGFAYIAQHYDKNTVVVTVDADGQHSAEDALKLAMIAACHPDTLILGKRSFTGNVPLRSRFGNTLTRLVYRLSTGQSVYDTQTGLRAFSVSLLPQLMEVPGKRYEYEMNMLLVCARANIPIREEEILTIYLQNNASSHFDLVKDSFRVYKDILKFSVSSFLCFLTDYSLYGLFLFLTGSLAFANIGARLFSASLNYTLNRNYVFHSRVSILKSALSYILLAGIILLGNTWLLGLLVNRLGIGYMTAKLMTESFFFLLSIPAQKFLVFRRGHRHKIPAAG